MPNLLKQAIAEAIGTFTLIFIGAGTIMFFLATKPDSNNNPGISAAALVGVALAHGLAIAVMVSATGHISGGHLNPAVTLGLFAGGKVQYVQAVTYVIAQLIGASLASALLLFISPEGVGALLVQATPDLGSFGDQKITSDQGIVIEAVLTFFLVFVVCGTAVDQRTAGRIGGLGIGLTITMDILMGGRLTGASMNPARTFGPALLTGHWDHHFVYWAGPVLGGALAGILYCRVLMDDKPQ